MSILSRRKFLKKVGEGSAAAALALPLDSRMAIAAPSSDCSPLTVEQSLDETWLFKLDPQAEGEASGWYQSRTADVSWENVTVPHTWQVTAKSEDYFGAAWYRRDFDAPVEWAGQAVRLEFEAVFHSAKVWLNGQPIGEHLGKGYTAFTLDAGAALQLGERNHLAVRVDNSFDEHMLPRGHSYDWAPDGGITRPVRLLVSPLVFIERVDVDAQPDLEANRAGLNVWVALRNHTAERIEVGIRYRIEEDETGLTVLHNAGAATASLKPYSSEYLHLPQAALANPRLWHFDHPYLYRLVAEIEWKRTPGHQLSTAFGIRKIEARNGGFHLNGERVWLMGGERMAGSNPDFGMAEPSSWIDHDHGDLKELNCVFTRVHWQQDKRVLDYCDRHGILFQEEVPAWGGYTFQDMTGAPSPDIMKNGLEQLEEMIQRDRNHPCIVAWGLCNETNGQHPPAYEFARQMLEKAKKLDPHRLCTYASNSLQTTPEKDVSGLMDFIEWNEYYETWYKGGVADVNRNLEAIHRAFPEKPIVISEYGYCECTPDRTGGDPKRIDILRSHTNAYRQYDYVAGAIFFDYNDYRTHVGDKGFGALKQRVHGVVDPYGTRKPSYESLRRESSPIEELHVGQQAGSHIATVVTRKKMPAYCLEGYRLRWVTYGFDELPMEKHEAFLPRLEPGGNARVQLSLEELNPKRIVVDVVRPTGFSAMTVEWRPA